MNLKRAYLQKAALVFLLAIHVVAGHAILLQFVVCEEPDGRVQVERFQDQGCCVGNEWDASENPAPSQCQDCFDTSLVDLCHEFNSRTNLKQISLIPIAYIPLSFLDRINTLDVSVHTFTTTRLFASNLQKILPTFILLI